MVVVVVVGGCQRNQAWHLFVSSHDSEAYCFIAQNNQVKMSWSLKLHTVFIPCMWVLKNSLVVERNIFLPFQCVPFWFSVFCFFLFFKPSRVDLTIHYRLQSGSPSALSDIFTEENDLLGPVSGWPHIQISWTLHPWSYCSLKILISFHGFRPSVVMTTCLLCHGQCQQTSYDLVMFRSNGRSVCEKMGYVSAD